ncbi:spore coat protein SP60-like [Amphibalanus amphitrite]|uniref:spore coat protein SP60-like n=1 Tax=Amphibalanus amphitrite TaxID=1232801 RepID=UPI001C9273A3|nr:spore coat protein SP60-like [Amphibalanus amphitrite]
MRQLLLASLVCAVSAEHHERISLVQVGPPNECVANTCGDRYTCEVRECRCEACIPKKLTCKDIKCEPNEKCVQTADGPECQPRTCADIRCAAGEKCDELPDGPDCVPDVPTCEGFFCRRGTNCYIRQGSPICLPNTCEVRECEPGLNCIDTPDGALCRKGEPIGTCEGKYCPPNTVCQTSAQGPTCAHI